MIGPNHIRFIPSVPYVCGVRGGYASPDVLQYELSACRLGAVLAGGGAVLAFLPPSIFFSAKPLRPNYYFLSAVNIFLE
jgi:hypothetical protein